MTNQIAAHLYRRRLLARVDTDLLRLLLIPNPESETAAVELRSLGMYTHRGPIAVMVAGAPDGEQLHAVGLNDLAHAVQRATEQAPPGTVLGGVISDVGVLLVPVRDHSHAAFAQEFAEKVRRLVAHVNNQLDVAVGIGGATELERAHHSYAEARRTLAMIRAMPDVGPIAAWEELGVFRLGRVRQGGV